MAKILKSKYKSFKNRLYLLVFYVTIFYIVKFQSFFDWKKLEIDVTYFSGLDKKLQKDNNKPKMPKPKVWAIVLTVVASVGYFGLFASPYKF